MVARHPRLTRRGASDLILDHYLEILLGKPGALPGSTALAQARAERGVHRRARGVLGRGPRRATATPKAPGR